MHGKDTSKNLIIASRRKRRKFIFERAAFEFFFYPL